MACVKLPSMHMRDESLSVAGRALGTGFEQPVMAIQCVALMTKTVPVICAGFAEHTHRSAKPCTQGATNYPHFAVII